MEEVAKELSSNLRMYGCRKIGEPVPIVSLAILAGSLFLLYESVMSLIWRWDDIHKRFLAIEDVNIWLCVSTVRVYLVIFYQTPYKMVDAIRGTKLKILNEREKELADAHGRTALRQLRFFMYTTRVILANAILAPCLLFTYKVFQAGRLIPEEAVLPFEFYHMSSTSLVTLVLVFQIGFAKTAIDGGRLVCLSLLGVVRRVVLDIQLLVVAIEEIDNRVARTGQDGDYQHRLKRYLSKIIAHHSNICRSVTVCNSAGSFFAIMGFQSICGQLCLLFYWLVEVDDGVLLKIIDITQILLFIAFTYLYASLGQNITDEGEKLREKLYKSSWLGKPIWFQKSLLLMMTRADKVFELRPYGLYTISLRKFTAVVNAAYSSYNLLRTFKNL